MTEVKDVAVLDPDEIQPDDDYHLKYDTNDMTPEQYEELPVKPVRVPKTRPFNIHKMFDLTAREGNKEDRQKFIAKLLGNIPSEEFELLKHKWGFWARHNQLAPPGLWTYWTLLAGRGFGKTRTGAEWIHQKVEDGSAKRIALVAPTAADVRKVMVEGESGLLATAKPWNRPTFEPSKLQLTWPNGAIAQMFSAEEPERLRGPQCDTFWADELAAWKKMQETWDMLMFGFRLGRHPQGCITTTPKPVPIVKELVTKAIEERNEGIEDPSTVLTKGSTYDNKGNLAKPFFQQVVSKYEGTRLGRQELDAEILEDMPGALWNRPQIDANRKSTANILPIQSEEILELVNHDLEKEPGSNWYPMQWEHLRERAKAIAKAAGEDLSRIVVAVDPNASNDEGSDEIGITVAAKGVSGHGYVLADVSLRGSPNEWASSAIMVHDLFDADRIVGEANQGGNMVEHTITSACKFLRLAKKRKSDFVAITLVHATRGKVTRAEPVSALYEQNRVSHVGTHKTLEDQMCLFTSDFDRKAMGYSPDRVDSVVWSLTHLYLEGNDTGLLEFYQMQHQKRAASEAAKNDPTNRTTMIVPKHMTRVFGKSGTLYVAKNGQVSVDPADVPGLRAAGLKEKLS